MFEPLAEPEPVVPSDSERILARAGDKLAALQRDLALATASAQQAAAAPPPPSAPSPVPELATARTPVEAVAPMTIDSAEPEEPPPAVIGERRSETTAREDVELWFDPTSAADRRWAERPRRGRRAMVVVIALAFFVAPAAVWTYRHPEQANAWRERLENLAQETLARLSQPMRRTDEATSPADIAASPPPIAQSEAAARPAPDASAPAASAQTDVPEDDFARTDAFAPSALAAPELSTRGRTSAKGRASRAPARRSQ